MKYATRINSFLNSAKSVTSVFNDIGQIDGVNFVDMNYPEHFTDTSIEKVQKSLMENGLKLNAINLRFRNEFINGAFDNNDPDIRNKAILLCKQAADICKELGGRQCIIWLGFDGFDYSFQKNYVTSWDLIVENFKRICTSVDCKISVEYKPYEERAFAMIDSWGVAWKLVQDVNCSNFGVTLDVCHMLMKKENPALAAAILLKEKKLFGIHINDGEGSTDNGLIVGSVHPWKMLELFYYLVKYEYDEIIYFDTFPVREKADGECKMNIRMVEIFEKMIIHIGMDKFEQILLEGDGLKAVEIMADLLNAAISKSR